MYQGIKCKSKSTSLFHRFFNVLSPGNPKENMCMCYHCKGVSKKQRDKKNENKNKKHMSTVQGVGTQLYAKDIFWCVSINTITKYKIHVSGDLFQCMNKSIQTWCTSISNGIIQNNNAKCILLMHNECRCWTISGLRHKY